MNMMLKLAGALAVVALGVAVPAAALPPQCEFNCTCEKRCSTLCAEGGHVTNCGVVGICIGMCRAGGVEAASATLPADQGRDDESLLEQILVPQGCPADTETVAATSAD